jgi:mannose-6-phosphate isomerase-like protein (cupin superfamily)
VGSGPFNDQGPLLQAVSLQVCVSDGPAGKARGPSTRHRQVGAFYAPVVGYHVADSSKLEWEERPPAVEGQAPRQAADVTTAAGLQHSRGRVWRYPAGTRGKRHADKVQEEVFVVISGALTMLLGDPPERIDVGPESVVAVEPGTPLQVRNEGGEELVLYIYGAPPEQGGADFFDDVAL